MSNIRIFFILAAISLIAIPAPAQSFFPGIVMVTGGIEFGGYQVMLDDPDPNAKNSGANLSRNLPFSLEVGIAERMGLGVQYRNDKYLNNTDSARAESNDFSLLFNYHFVVTQQTNSFVGLRVGMSDFSFEKSRTSETFESKGPAFQLCAGANMLIRSKIGLQFTLGMNSFIYSNGELKNPAGTSTEYGVIINGISLGMAALFIL
jgi:hypothetical protein